MINRIQEHKIIAMQAVIFLSLLVMLSLILEGCTLKESEAPKNKIEIGKLRINGIENPQEGELPFILISNFG